MVVGNRKAANICLWVMILIGIVLVSCLFVIPRFAAYFSEMSDGEKPLPLILKVVFNLSDYAIHNGLLLTSLYVLLLGGVIFWNFSTKTQTDDF